MKPNNFFYVKCVGEFQFLRAWMEFLTPYHKLTDREKDVGARILQQYFKFLENVPDPDVRRELLWSRNSRKDMMASLKMSQAHFQMVLARLRKEEAPNTAFLQGEDINPRYLPHMIKDENRLMLQMMFDWTTLNHPASNAQSA